MLLLEIPNVNIKHMTNLEDNPTLFPIKMTLLMMNNFKCRRDNKARSDSYKQLTSIWYQNSS